MDAERAIVHLNVADFAVAVERAMDTRLATRPLMIAPRGTTRAVVYDMSQEAYLAGVRKGMPLFQALRRCPEAHVLSPHRDRYERAMGAVLKQVLPYSPLIERGEDDGHLFVDVTGTSRLFGPAIDVAWRLQRQVKKDLGLAPIWSVAPNKLVAKVATRLVKPLGEYTVGAGEEENFLAPLPVYLLPGLEPFDLSRFRSLNLTIVDQAAALTLPQLQVPFGKRAPFIYETLRGIDVSPVRPVNSTPPKVAVSHAFDTDTNEEMLIEAALYRLVEQAGRKLRDRRLAARRLGLFLDYADGVRRIRSAGVRPPSANDFTLFEQARAVLTCAWTRRVRIRSIKLVLDRLTFPPAQRSLFPGEEKETQKRTHLVSALDTIRDRFGEGAVCVGRLAG